MSRKSTRTSRRTRNDELADRLHSAALHLLRRLRRVDEASGISPAKLSALSVLVFGGPKSVTELADAEQVRPPTITRMAKELESDGLIKRKPKGEDRRVVRLVATAKSIRLLKRGRTRRVELLAEWLDELNPADRIKLRESIDVLERFVRA